MSSDQLTSRRPWQTVDTVALAVLLFLAGMIAWPAWADMFRIGLRDAEQSHILLAAPVAIWLAWLRRSRLRRFRPQWSALGTLIIAVGAAMALLGVEYRVDVAWHLGGIGVVVGAAVTVVGSRMLMQFGPCFAALVFLLPVPGIIREPIAQPLQSISAQASQFGLELFAIPVSRAGNVLTVNGFPVEIADACNGMRMVSALALIAFAFIFSVPMNRGVRLAILLASPLVAVAVNVLRLVPTALFYGYADDPSVADLFHDLSGWLGLLVAMGMLWGFLGVLRWLEVPISTYAIGRVERR